METGKLSVLRPIAALFAIASACLAAPPGVLAADCKSPAVVMSLPDRPDNPFWGPCADYTEAVARDIGVRLTIDFSAGNDRFDYVERLQQALSATEKPDYVVAFPYFGALPLLMEEAARSGTAVATLNADLGRDDREAVGYPRERYKNWILQSMADDEKAGFELAGAIDHAARDRFGFDADAIVSLSAIGGNQFAGSSLNRRYGLERFIRGARGRTAVNQFVFTDWSYERGRDVAAGLIQRYKPTHGIWTVSLPLGLGAADAWQATGTGRPAPALGTVSGPFDDRALTGIEDGTFSAVVGGHFLEGGILMVLLLDHFNGLDFVDDIGTGLRIPFRTVDRTNVAAVRALLGDRVWRGRDYTHLSKCHDKALAYYDFSLANLLR